MTRRLIAMIVAAASFTATPTAAAPVPADFQTRGPGCPRYESLLARHGLPVRVFSRIMWRESGCQKMARNVNRNGSVDRGLLQINSIHLKPGGSARGFSAAQLYSPEVNVRVAARLYDRYGMSPWT